MQSANVTTVELAALSPLDDVHTLFTLLNLFLNFFKVFIESGFCGLYHQCHLSFAG